MVWDGEDASRALLRVAAKNVPLKHVRKAVAEAVGEEEAGALASDEAIRVSGLSRCGIIFRRPTPTTRQPNSLVDFSTQVSRRAVGARGNAGGWR